MKHDLTRLKEKLNELALEAYRHGWMLSRVDMRKGPELNEGDHYENKVIVNIDDPDYEASSW